MTSASCYLLCLVFGSLHQSCLGGRRSIASTADGHLIQSHDFAESDEQPKNNEKQAALIEKLHEQQNSDDIALVEKSHEQENSNDVDNAHPVEVALVEESHKHNSSSDVNKGRSCCNRKNLFCDTWKCDNGDCSCDKDGTWFPMCCREEKGRCKQYYCEDGTCACGSYHRKVFDEDKKRLCCKHWQLHPMPGRKPMCQRWYCDNGDCDCDKRGKWLPECCNKDYDLDICTHWYCPNGDCSCDGRGKFKHDCCEQTDFGSVNADLMCLKWFCEDGSCACTRQGVVQNQTLS
eukprot:gnl/TRDRNA2_/TRDRNA2_189006_c0_seq1.p1 gnl/TRDRNA2_/TRDRNA2_189006_c0~~gnl/TRDRNA2_/TRDRNA2_189006_c0_seq1.p1  ORF type:complete len:290 (+),score=33.44 gnl/TRDRNA2_/TRDRNA2_189006_c0_seq1:83-952(+)